MLAPLLRFTDLSFVESASKAWVPERTGNYADDCARGRRYARELLNFMREKNDPLPFNQVVRSMTDGGTMSGVEIGFCTEIGIYLIGLPVLARLG